MLYTTSLAVGPGAAKSTYNSEPVAFKHAETFKHSLRSTSVALAVWPPSTYLKSFTAEGLEVQGFFIAQTLKKGVRSIRVQAQGFRIWRFRGLL